MMYSVLILYYSQRCYSDCLIRYLRNEKGQKGVVVSFYTFLWLFQMKKIADSELVSHSSVLVTAPPPVFTEQWYQCLCEVCRWVSVGVGRESVWVEIMNG